MSKPIAVMMIVDGTPKRRWLQKVRLYPWNCALRACSQTIRFAAEPRSVRLPATVLTQASMSQAFFSEAGEIAPADAATLVPSSSTEENLFRDDMFRTVDILYKKKSEENKHFAIIQYCYIIKKLPEVAAWRIIKVIVYPTGWTYVLERINLIKYVVRNNRV